MDGRAITLKLDDSTYNFLEREGRAVDQSPSELARTLLEEWRRMQEHPCIVFRTGPAGRRAGLVGGPDVWEVARVLRSLNWSDSANRRRAAELTGLNAAMLDPAQRYYATYRDEIDAWIARLDREAEAALAASVHHAAE